VTYFSPKPDRPNETGVRPLPGTPVHTGLSVSLVGCFPGDPAPASGYLLDHAGPLELRLPAEVFANGPRPTEVIPRLESQPVPASPVPSSNSAAASAAVTALRPSDVRSGSEPSLPAVGSVIEKYRIEELLGTGGFAAVYRATHLLLRIPVALKLLKPKVLRQRPLLADLLCEEARFAAQLNHANVVRVFDVTHNPKITYIVMEYIEGESLHQAIQRKGRLRPEKALKVGLEVTQGLKAALDEGLIHRDIKPANILIARTGIAKIVDLGLAQHSDDLARNRNSETDRMIVGTPMYMAPEQAARPDDVDFRADVYSLGATLYHAITGRPPFQTDETVKVLAMHQKDPVPPPEDFVPGLPYEVSRVLLWMLAKDRASRPDYDQLLAGLDEARQAVALEQGIEGLVG
jgi:serine/threonine protein kinase